MAARPLPVPGVLAGPARRLAAGFVAVYLVSFGLVRAGDWPQILGPHRNGHADGEQLTAWGAAGPRVLWSQDVGEGYAGPAVAQRRVFVFHRREAVERLEALEAASGQRLWSTDFPAAYRGGVDPDRGPRCVPLVHAGRVYVHGAAGDLHCVDVNSGRQLWSRGTHREFGGNEGYFGAGSSPIVVGDKVLLNVGGEPDAGIVAFSLEDGRTCWKSTAEKASYASPTVARLGGQPLVVFATRLTLVALNPADGTVRFRLPFGRRGPTVNAATPVVCGDGLFLTANYGVGAKLLTLGGASVAEVWSNDDSLSSQYATPVFAEGYLYGVHGREDVGVPDLRCVAASTGKVQWSEAGFGTAHVILAGDKLLILTVDGRLVLARASPQSLQILAQTRLTQAITRALPALAEGRLYVRDTAPPGGKLHCLQW